MVAKAAQLALGEQAIAVTARSPSLAEGELDEAVQLAGSIGIRHHIVDTGEIDDPRYAKNNPDRCYFCKSTLYEHLDKLLDQLRVNVIANGTNADDLGDYRPGLRAADEHRVRSPLADVGLTKSEVRSLAADWELTVWDKPAMPCLASRIAYGEQVTDERLRMIDRAEQFLREQGIREVRVRYHRGDLARIEVPVEQLAFFGEAAVRDSLVRRFTELGFQNVTVDLKGFRSGSLNALIPLETLRGETRK